MEFTAYHDLLITLGDCIRITRSHILALIVLAELTLGTRHSRAIQVTEARNAREILRRRRLQNRKKRNGHK